MNYLRIPVALAFSLNNPCALGIAIALRAVAANIGPLPDDIEKCRDLLTGAYGRHLAEHWGAVRATFEARDGMLIDQDLEDDRETYRRMQINGKRMRANALARRPAESASEAASESACERASDSGPVRSGPVLSCSTPTPEKKPAADKPPPPRRERKEAQGDHPEAIRFWERTWERTRGTAWAWQPQDTVAISRALSLAKKTHNGHALEEFEARALRCLEAQDGWTAENASPRVLASQWHKFGHKIVPKPKTALQATLDGLEAMFDEKGQLKRIGGAA